VASQGVQRSNIEIVFSDWLDAMRCGDLERMEAVLAPDVKHIGIVPEWECGNREQVLENVRNRGARVPAVEALELVAAGEHVVMTIRAPEIGPVPDDGPPPGQACIVFTLKDGLITHMRDYVHRADALAAADAGVDWA
jgi:ketosteroid isomerase-like protein